MRNYDFFTAEVINKNINRLTNQLWKLIPMREHGEPWNSHLETVLLEIIGLNEIFKDSVDFLILISKLEGLLHQETEFSLYRKIVFETISLLRGMLKHE